MAFIISLPLPIPDGHLVAEAVDLVIHDLIPQRRELVLHIQELAEYIEREVAPVVEVVEPESMACGVEVLQLLHRKRRIGEVLLGRDGLKRGDGELVTQR